VYQVWPSGLYELSKAVVWDMLLDSGEDTDARTLATEILIGQQLTVLFGQIKFPWHYNLPESQQFFSLFLPFFQQSVYLCNTV